MDRRAYLGGVAGVIVSACSGCVSDSGTGGVPAEEPNEDDTTTAEPTTREPTGTDRPERAGANSNDKTPPTVNERLLNTSNTTTQKVIALEDREPITEVADDADSIGVLNDDADSRRIKVTIATESRPDEPLYHEQLGFEPNAWISFQVTKPRTYRIVVTTAARSDTEPVTFETDNCNDQSLGVTVTSDGSVESIAQSTMMECVTWQF